MRTGLYIGIVNNEFTDVKNQYVGKTEFSWGMLLYNGCKFHKGSCYSYCSTSISIGDRIVVWIDRTNGILSFSLND